MSLPMSGRLAESENAYQLAKKHGQTMPLEFEPAVKKWDHWRSRRTAQLGE